MKRIVLVLLVCYISSSFGELVVDEFSVIKVIGGIKHAKTNKALFTGDKVYSNEKLKFAESSSKAALISKEKGRFMLNANPSGTVKEGLLPAMNNVSSRAGALLNSVDIKKHFADKYLILSGYEVEISSVSYPMDADHFFYLKFNYNGEEISKKLSFSEGKLKLDQSEILKIDGKSISLKEGTKVELVYRNAKDKTSESLAVFEPVFTNEKALKDECKLIVSELGADANAEIKKDQLLAYLTENYGKPNQENFNNWLKQNLGI